MGHPPVPASLQVPRWWQTRTTCLSSSGVEVVFQCWQIPPIIPLCTGSQEPHAEKTNAIYSLNTYGRVCRSRIGALCVRSSFLCRRLGLRVRIECEVRRLGDRLVHVARPQCGESSFVEERNFCCRGERIAG